MRKKSWNFLLEMVVALGSGTRGFLSINGENLRREMARPIDKEKSASLKK